ncbi:unnamed protein product [Protopolystoma xenopodis]|uniref:Uncharacterized protein n=1 Tax=Protopolystoma xenopodis TaxID=117903 RepID=A0A448WTF9_9PLAT|nr:unnamed protein product [Protopolystoma xenopodis]
MPARRLGRYPVNGRMLEFTNTMAEDVGLGTFHKVYLTLRPTLHHPSVKPGAITFIEILRDGHSDLGISFVGGSDTPLVSFSDL